jgi:hypothetical protein
LFQPGLFLEYLACPHQTSSTIIPLQTPWNFEARSAIVTKSHDPVLTFTSIDDIAAIVVRAVASEQKWPVIGGLSGMKLTVSELIRLGERVRGKYGMRPSRKY